VGSVLYLKRPNAGREGVPEAAERPSSPRQPESLLRIGYNCSAVARAERVALLVDAAAYFRAFHDAALNAQRSITILAWDFNSQAQLHFDPVEPGGPPALLGDFLNWLVRRRRSLHINVLNWDYPMVFGTDREFPPLYGFGWTPERRVHLRYDDTHPVAGCQHQKVVLIDDALAFVGGIDLTVRRWDTEAHRADDPRRVAGGVPYPPFHDAMVAVDGDAAKALAELARGRWLHATGKRLPASRAAGDPWPAGLRTDLTGVEVGISRTMPPCGEVPAVREIERLYLDMIGAARRTIYIENQYFTAPRLAAALAERLSEPDGPEVVLVLRLLSHGWLEEHTMHVLRTRLVRKLKEADVHGRFHVCYPHVPNLPKAACVDVHSKIMIVDDRWLRIGSANLCNRSMALDSECDLLIESRDRPVVAKAITAFRDRLIAEHLGVEPAAVRRRTAEGGSLHAAIVALSKGDGRTLKELDELPDWPEAVVNVAAVADPEEPIALEALMHERAAAEGKIAAERRPWGKLLAIVAVVAGLTALWRYTPLATFVTPDRVIGWAQEFSSSWWAVPALLLSYTVACFVMFPRPLITLAGVIAFGAWLGFVYALVGIVFSAAVTYFVGMRMRRDTVRRLAGKSLDKMVEVLKKHGLLAMTLLRLVPIAPFAVEGIVAGAVRLKLWHVLVGTAIGMLPGSLATTIFGDQLQTALSGTGQINWWLVGGIAALFAGGIWGVRLWFRKMAARTTSVTP
jgi:phospholipase D1/2